MLRVLFYSHICYFQVYMTTDVYIRYNQIKSAWKLLVRWMYCCELTSVDSNLFEFVIAECTLVASSGLCACMYGVHACGQTFTSEPSAPQ